ncbi:DUF503 domain-containing protein [Alkalihalobacillus pseudalcaliphilus]|uniref:DUF503 domain-containing protein n=1 Tax=Alkalihalobacillus pseudalcaliphilus TaxID=79884 RepID=UPI00064D7D73|nr:DUF503 family protein [Alkalihalobacillus pseudalcaliphilus]KMK77254.1 hypothetical protein AB990_06830 [Alkalihalobacillus pseudalcaliphilus]
MIIGSIRCELIISDVHSLKEKRSVLKSILTRLKQKYNLSIAETDYQDVWQRAEVSIVTVGNTRAVCEKELQRGLALIDQDDRAERTLTDYEWL